MPQFDHQLVLVAEEVDWLQLRDQFPEGVLVDGDALLLSGGDLQAPVVCLRPAQLNVPGAIDTIEYRRWCQLWHLLSGRVIVRVERLSAKEDIQSLAERARLTTKKIATLREKVQGHVRAFADALIVILEETPEPTQIEELEKAMTEPALERPQQGATQCYLMMPQLRVARIEQKLPFSRYVWHFAVADLIRLFVSKGLIGRPGINAWRAFRIAKGGVSIDGSDSSDSELDAFVEWLKTVEQTPRDGSPIAPELASDSPTERAKQVDTIWERILGWGSQLRAWCLRQDLSITKSDPRNRSPKQTASDKVESPDTGDEEKRLGIFRDLPLGGEGEAAGLVSRITSPDKITSEASKAGATLRRQQLEGVAKTGGRISAQSQWQKCGHDSPPTGGPGKLLEWNITAEHFLGAGKEGEALDKVFRAWTVELSQDQTDYERKRHALQLCATELQFARTAFVALWPRVLMGFFCLIIVLTVTVMALRAWSAVWEFGKPANSSAVEFKYVLLFGFSAAMGAVGGIFLPYAMEATQGRSAGKGLAARAVALKESRVATLNRRLKLCRAALIDLSPELLALSIFKQASALAGRGWSAIRNILDDRSIAFANGNGNCHEAGGIQGAMDEVGRFSINAYKGLCLCVVTVEYAETGAPKQVVSMEPREAPWKKIVTAFWTDTKMPDRFPSLDVHSRGWFPSVAIAKLLPGALRVVVSNFEKQAVKSGEIKWEKVVDKQVKHALELWLGKVGEPGENLGMLSLHVNAYAVNSGKGKVCVKTSVISPHKEFSDVLQKECQTVKGHDAEGSPERVKSVFCEDLLAVIVQIVPVRYEKERADNRDLTIFGMQESDGDTA